jgi:hypothetical protein
MVFISKNLFRKCKYCEKEKKKNISPEGKHKGYNTTCGSKECLNRQYEDSHVCGKKGRIKNPENLTCVICSNKFERTTTARRVYCLECAPDDTWRNKLRRYGIGKKQWDLLLSQQNGKCALCEKIPEVIDHCHKEGIVRGLLCNSCNTNLTFLEKDHEFLKRAFEYIGRPYV